MPIPRSRPQKRKRDQSANLGTSVEPVPKKLKRGWTVPKKLKRGRTVPRKLKRELKKSVELVPKNLKREGPKPSTNTVTSSPKNFKQEGPMPSTNTVTSLPENVNRQYYHVGTNLPIKPDEKLDEDPSDNDDVCIELSNRRIDRLSGVTDLQKTMMKLWDAHRIKTKTMFRGAVHMANSCLHFVEQNKSELVQIDLYKEFMYHLINLHEVRLLSMNALNEVVNTANKLHGVKYKKRLAFLNEDYFRKYIRFD